MDVPPFAFCLSPNSTKVMTCRVPKACARPSPAPATAGNGTSRRAVSEVRPPAPGRCVFDCGAGRYVSPLWVPPCLAAVSCRLALVRAWQVQDPWCAPHHTGPLCEVCVSGYVLQNEDCVDCTTGGFTIRLTRTGWVVVGVTIGVVVLVVLRCLCVARGRRLLGVVVASPNSVRAAEILPAGEDAMVRQVDWWRKPWG